MTAKCTNLRPKTNEMCIRDSVCAVADYTAEPQLDAILSVADAFISDYRRPPRVLRPEAVRSEN